MTGDGSLPSTANHIAAMMAQHPPIPQRYRARDFREGDRVRVRAGTMALLGQRDVMGKDWRNEYTKPTQQREHGHARVADVRHAGGRRIQRSIILTTGGGEGYRPLHPMSSPETSIMAAIQTII